MFFLVIASSNFLPILNTYRPSSLTNYFSSTTSHAHKRPQAMAYLQHQANQSTFFNYDQQPGKLAQPQGRNIFHPVPKYTTETWQQATTAATAAASGQRGNPFYLGGLLKQDPSPHTPETLQQATTAATAATSGQGGNQFYFREPARQEPSSHTPPASVPTSQQHSQPLEPAPEESPVYVNAKQFRRILVRRVARQRLEEALRLTSKGRKPYLHESRHNHAMRRPRGPGGRFLTADEVEARTKNNGSKENEGPHETPNGLSSAAGGSGTKRKADTNDPRSSKRARENLYQATGWE